MSRSAIPRRTEEPLVPIIWTDAAVSGFGVFVAIHGGSTSGKTYTGLRICRGLVGPKGKIAVCDTEGGRTSHYAGEFGFKQFRMGPPFFPHRFVEVAKSAQGNGFDALMIDNYSLEWAGEGGVLDLFDKEATRRYGDDEDKRKRGTQAVWAAVKPAHKEAWKQLLQITMPIVFILRAEEKTKPDAAGVPQPLGWVPICDARHHWEWTVMVGLHPDAPGVPNWKLKHKVEGQHRHLFPDGQLITEKVGEGLRAWSRSGLSVAGGTSTATHAGSDGGGPGGRGATTPAAGSASDTGERERAAKFVADVLGVLGKIQTADAIRQYLAGRKVKPNVEALAQHYPDLSQKLDDGIDGMIEAIEARGAKAPADQRAKAAELPKAEPPAAQVTKGNAADEKFVDDLLDQFKGLDARTIDGTLQQVAVARRITKMHLQNEGQHTRLMAGIAARRAELARAKGRAA